MLKLAAFDFDGVLADTEPLHQQAKELLGRKLGGAASPDYAAYVGRPNREFWLDWAAMNHIEDVDLPQMEARQYDVIVELAMEQRLKPTPGLSAFLDFLAARDVTLAVCSSSGRGYLEKMLLLLGLSRYFAFLVGGDEVPRKKPAPDVYLRALELSSTPATQTFAVEDSAAGITAALAAGCTAIGFQNPGSGEQDLSRAHIVINRFDALQRFSSLMLTGTN